MHTLLHPEDSNNRGVFAALNHMHWHQALMNRPEQQRGEAHRSRVCHLSKGRLSPGLCTIRQHHSDRALNSQQLAPFHAVPAAASAGASQGLCPRESCGPV